ncbi:MAG: helix-turn-helix transcriptional regulator [Thermomicrobiales bacterium]
MVVNSGRCVTSAPADHAGTPLLAGRERELRVLRDHIAAALGGHGRLALIGGEAGIGKTTLADTVCREAADTGALILTGHCYDLTETPPYGPWLDLFARYRPDDGVPPLPAPFAGRGVLDAVASQTALFTDVRDFLAAVAATRPLVLLLDDLHWADPASLDLLRFLARHLSAMSLLLIVTYRADELTRRHPLAALLPLLVREAGAARLDLGRLSDTAVHALVGGRYRLSIEDEPRLVAYLQERAEGNALFVTEVLRTLEETGTLRETGGRWTLGETAHVAVPPLLRQVIEGRVDRLGEAAHHLLAVAAVIGQEVPLGVWATVAGESEETLSAVVEQAAMAHLMEETPDGRQARFVHALIRETLYEGILPSRRRRMHRQAGETLAALLGPDPDAVAYHYQQAGDGRAAGWLVTAGERAQRAYAWLTAADRFEAALAQMEGSGADAGARGWLLYRLAALRRVADPRGGIARLDEAAPLAEGAGDPVLAAQIAYLQGHLRCLSGNYEEGLPRLEAAVVALEAFPPTEPGWRGGMDIVDARMARSVLLSSLADTGRFARARAIGEQHLAQSGDEFASPADADVLWGLYIAHAHLGKPDAAWQAFLSARAIFRAMGDLRQFGLTHFGALLWIVLPYRADDVMERRRMQAVVEETWARGEGETEARLASARLPLQVIEGHWEETRHLTVDRLNPSARAVAIALLAHLAHAQGERERASEYVQERLPHGPQTEPGNIYFQTVEPLQRLAISLSLDAGDLPTARDWLEAHDRWLDWSGSLLGKSEGQALWATYHRSAGDSEQAYHHVTQALIHATEPRQPLALLAAHRLLGELDTDAGRYDDAAIHLNASLALADACAAPYERALTLLAMAELRIATGEAADARALLDEARAICTPLGAQPALTRADALAARLATRADAPPTYPAGLSPREVEVLRLVVAGQTNREIATALFLSEHTVRVHVRNILTKTDAQNRTEAATFALRHGLA